MEVAKCSDWLPFYFGTNIFSFHCVSDDWQRRTMEFAHLKAAVLGVAENKGFCEALSSQRERSEGDQLA